MSRSFTYVTSTPAKPFNPLAGTPLLRPAHRVMGYSAQQKAEWALAVAVRDLAGAEQHYAACCADLGRANAYGRLNMRAAYKATAFRQINKARAQRRAAVKALAAAQDALLAFAPVAAAA